MFYSSLKDVLVCDVEHYVTSDKEHYIVYIYNKVSLIDVCCSKEQANYLTSLIGKFVCFDCEVTYCNGILLHKLLPEAEIKVKE